MSFEQSRFEQSRIETVEHKLNALSLSIEQLTQSMGEVKVGLDAIRREHHRSAAPSITRGGLIGGDYGDLDGGRVMTATRQQHKDILEDGDGLDWEEREEGRGLAPEMQVQRLTAQLTAAYSRIAALEEQLLSRRIH